EDGIRDGHVTGVQTCALPILTKLKEEEVRFRTALYVFVESGARDPAQETAAKAAADIALIIDDAVDRAAYYSYRTSELIESTNRSEERRVGKGGRMRLLCGI